MADYYATYEDVVAGLGDSFDTDKVDTLLDEASGIIEDYFALNEKDIMEADPGTLKRCCVAMVRSQLRTRVGSDYGETLDYDSTDFMAQNPMDMPKMYRILLDLNRGTFKMGSIRLAHHE